jgi:DNA gyrase/topoisomerase IV subunit A
VKEAFGVPRRTPFSEAEGDIDDEALIPREEMVVTVTHGGYVKRTPLNAYRSQHRGLSRFRLPSALGIAQGPSGQIARAD